MALDASIYGNLLGRPARAIDDWTNHFQAQDDAKQQRAMNALALQLKQGELEQARQTQTDQNTLRTLLANLQDRTPEGQIKALEGSGLPLGLSQAQALRKDLAAQQKQASDLATAEATRQKTEQEVRQKAKQFAIQALQAAQTPEQAEAYVNAGVQQGAWGMNEATMLVQQMRSDPRGYETWRRDQLRQILDADKQLPKMETRDAGGTVQTLRMDPVLGTVGVANSVAKTATPGEIMTDKRARDQEGRMWAQFNYQKGRDAQSDAEKKANDGKPLPPGALKMQQEALDAIGVSGGINADLKAIEGQIKDGRLSFGPVSNLANQGLNMAGMSTENSRNFASFRSSLERLRNESLRLNTGVQTDGDAQRAWNELFQNITDTKLVQQRLQEIQRINARGAELQRLKVDAVRSNYGKAPLDVTPQASQPAALDGGKRASGSILDQADAILRGGK